MKRVIAFLVIVISLTAISGFAAGRGGVGVGNGRSIFKSDSGFAVTYATALTLNVRSKEAFEISNDQLVKASEKVSKIGFVAAAGKVKNLAEAESLFRERNPGKEPHFVSFPGAKGLAWEERGPDRLLGIYYLLTSNLDFVEIALEAYTFGSGLELIAPIVNTFAYDLTRPVYQELQVSPGPWLAGSSQFLRIRITDDNSGVNPEWLTSATFDRLDASGERTRIYIPTWGELKAEGNDWYRLDFRVNRFVPSGDYLLTDMSVADRAYNVGGLWAERLSQGHYQTSAGGEKGPAIPLVVVKVKNAGKVDVEQPRIHELRPAPGQWKAGTWNKLFIRATDDVSGIDVKKIECRGLEFVPDAGKTTVNPPRGCRNPRHEGGDWYSIEVLVGEFLREGEYFVDNITVRDRANHGVSLSSPYPYSGRYRTFRRWQESDWGPVAKLRVRNGGRADVAAPVLQELRVDSHAWKAGTTQRLYFRATDDLSGVAVGSRTYGYIVPVDPRSERRAIYPDREIHDAGNGWFYSEVQVNAFIEGGEYYLSGFSFHDRAGNGTWLQCWVDNMAPGPCKNQGGPPIERLHIRIER